MSDKEKTRADGIVAKATLARATIALTQIFALSLLFQISTPQWAIALQTSDDAQLVDVIFVLDNSGSMRRNDPQFLTRKAVEDFVNAISEAPDIDGRVGIIVFDGSARLVQALTETRGTRAADLAASLKSSLDFSGQRTNSPSGIERALYELRNNGRTDAERAVILVTDGNIDTGNTLRDTEASRWLREDLAEESRAGNIRIFGIAFTESADYQLMQALALKTNANYYRAVQASDLDSAITDVLAQISTSKQLATANSAPGSDVPATPRSPITTLPHVSSQSARDASSRPEIYGWLPVAVFLVAGSLYWRRHTRRRGRASKKEAEADSAFVDSVRVAPAAQLFDLTGRLSGSSRSIDLQTGRTRIGRDPHNDIVLSQNVVSSEHATIEVRDAQHFIQDHRSKNGTYIGKRRLAEGDSVQLKSGDPIRFGEVEFMFVLVGYIAAGETVFLNPSTIPPPPSTDSRPLHEANSTSQDPALPKLVAVDARRESKNQPHLEAQETPENPSLIDDPGTLGPSISLLPSVDTEEQRSSKKEPHPVRPEAADRPDISRAAESFRRVLNVHLERVDQLSPTFSAFVKRGFDEEMRAAISVAADELFESSGAMQSIQHKAYTASSIRYVICAISEPFDMARPVFERSCGGFTRFLSELLQDDSFVRDRCEILVVLTFGSNGGVGFEPWVSLSIVPDSGPESELDLLSFEFLNEEERREILPNHSRETGVLNLA